MYDADFVLWAEKCFMVFNAMRSCADLSVFFFQQVVTSRPGTNTYPTIAAGVLVIAHASAYSCTGCRAITKHVSGEFYSPVCYAPAEGA